MMTDSSSIRLIHTSKENKIHRAGWVIQDPWHIIENGYVEIEDSVIKGIYQGRPRSAYTDHGPGVLMPPLVNAHVHLELCALKGLLPFDQGFEIWVQALLKEREAFGTKRLKQAAGLGINEMMGSGTCFIGEISTLGITRSLVARAGLKGIFFNEYLGTGADGVSTCKRNDDHLHFSVAGHAPHSTAPDLLKALKQQTASNGLPFSIHVAESRAEMEFIEGKNNEWAKFLTARDIDYSAWDIGKKTPVQYLDDLKLLDEMTLAVHLLHAQDRDVEILASRGTQVCVCPRSNFNLHQRLPDIEKMVSFGIHPCLGTDSLASCDSLNLFDEMAFTAQHYPNIAPEIILVMATQYGARALGNDKIAGTLDKGKDGSLQYIDINVKNKKNLIKRIVSNDHT
ncbi:MAG: amidohydrolase family protein [Desulfobacteraceae bacterium]|nr:amidohydrolase family protein [Desulfobacteraceae bacterium]